MTETNKETESVEAAHERGYLAGERAAWQSLLAKALSELRGAGAAPDDPQVRMGQLTLQLEQTRAALRSVCEDFGDNDWDDNLHLADVVEKHLARHLG
jgi:hypothetical protein